MLPCLLPETGLAEVKTIISKKQPFFAASHWSCCCCLWHCWMTSKKLKLLINKLCGVWPACFLPHTQLSPHYKDPYLETFRNTQGTKPFRLAFLNFKLKYHKYFCLRIKMHLFDMENWNVSTTQLTEC